MGSFMSVVDQNFPPKATWGVDEIPDLSGKVAIVTGGNSGIGKEIVKVGLLPRCVELSWTFLSKALLVKNAKVYMAGRNEWKCQLTIEELQEETSQTGLFLRLDLANLKSVKEAAMTFQSQESELHILINNGGVMLPAKDVVTADGYDLQFGTNALGHYYLTTLLIPQLQAGALLSDSKSARVVNLSSGGHTSHPMINWDTLKDGPARNKMGNFNLYNQSKFANIVFSSELAKRYGDKGIVSTSCHPGLIVSNLGRTVPQPIRAFFTWMSYDTAEGAITPLYAATSPQAANANGKYFIPWARVGVLIPQATDAETGDKLWKWFEEQTKDI
ncbi:NAD(P)-binding protein [Rickenella mellea]|uniref:NAD(P)-binding protein n=1 Tax=Rickenella mellea TaxID=50990 RepID=A0A4Y7QG53_9AGAM|nr:NAD(P)-binding protein [Rickenella mellea]